MGPRIMTILPLIVLSIVSAGGCGELPTESPARLDNWVRSGASAEPTVLDLLVAVEPASGVEPGGQSGGPASQPEEPQQRQPREITRAVLRENEAFINGSIDPPGIANIVAMLKRGGYGRVMFHHAMRKQPRFAELVEAIRAEGLAIQLHCFPQIAWGVPLTDHRIHRRRDGSAVVMSEQAPLWQARYLDEPIRALAAELGRYRPHGVYIDGVYADPSWATVFSVREEVTQPVLKLRRAMPELKFMQCVVDDFPEVLAIVEIGGQIDWRRELSYRENIDRAIRSAREWARNKQRGQPRQLGWVTFAAASWPVFTLEETEYLRDKSVELDWPVVTQWDTQTLWNHPQRDALLEIIRQAGERRNALPPAVDGD